MASEKWPRPVRDAPPGDDPRRPADESWTNGRVSRAAPPSGERQGPDAGYRYAGQGRPAAEPGDGQYSQTAWPASGWPPPPGDAPPTGRPLPADPGGRYPGQA